MPDPTQILDGLGDIARRFSLLAIAWHVVIFAAIVLLLAGRRPSRRLGALLPLPLLLSVGLLAFIQGNPFNGVVFLALAVILAAIALRLSVAKVRVSRGWLLAVGIVMVDFGLFYPHFLAGVGWARYLYAAPTGLVPCPTLSVVLGFVLILGGFGSRAYALSIAGLGLFYGLFGAFRLGVLIDSVLIAGAIVLLVAALRPAPPEGDPKPGGASGRVV
jgi:hypothetical protein